MSKEELVDGVGFNVAGCPDETTLPGEVQPCKTTLSTPIYNGTELETFDMGLRTYTGVSSFCLVCDAWL